MWVLIVYEYASLWYSCCQNLRVSVSLCETFCQYNVSYSVVSLFYMNSHKLTKALPHYMKVRVRVIVSQDIFHMTLWRTPKYSLSHSHRVTFRDAQEKHWDLQQLNGDAHRPTETEENSQILLQNSYGLTYKLRGVTDSKRLIANSQIRSETHRQIYIRDSQLVSNILPGPNVWDVLNIEV